MAHLLREDRAESRNIKLLGYVWDSSDIIYTLSTDNSILDIDHQPKREIAFTHSLLNISKIVNRMIPIRCSMFPGKSWKDPNNLKRPSIAKVHRTNHANELRTARFKANEKCYLLSVCQLISLKNPTFQGLSDSLNSPGDKKVAAEKHTCEDRTRRPTFPLDAFCSTPNEQYETMLLIAKSRTLSARMNVKMLHFPLGLLALEFDGIDSDMPNPDFHDNVLGYRDPHTTTPDSSSDHAAANLPPGRTRDYIPRKAKAPYINYVHSLSVMVEPLPSPPECCHLGSAEPVRPNFADIGAWSGSPTNPQSPSA